MIANQFFKQVRAVGLALALVITSGAAGAVPIDLFYNGSVPTSVGGGSDFFGLSAQSQTDFVTAGGQVFTGPFSLSLLGAQLSISITVDITPDYVPGGPDFALNPAQDQNDWMFTANQQLENVWIVFRGHDSTDVLGANNLTGGYLPQNVGLNLDPTSTTDIWRMLNLPADNSMPATSYLALYLGNLSSGQSVTKTIQYRVMQDIITNLSPGDLQFPQHLVGLMFGAVPEAGTVLLLVTTGLGLALRRRLV